MLIIVRHGRTEANASGRLLGRLDIPLDELGQRQAAQLAASLLATTDRIDRVVSSPLQRTRQTAAGLGLPVDVDERFVEVDYGEYDGLEMAAVGAEVWRQWRTDRAFRPPGGETFDEVDARVWAACEDLVADAAEGDVVVVSHVSPIKAAVAWALGVDGSIAWRMHLDVASISRINTSTRGSTLRSFNETAHLSL